jgi:hypothetical protein
VELSTLIRASASQLAAMHSHKGHMPDIRNVWHTAAMAS